MTIAEELMQEELDAHDFGDIDLCDARISNLKSGIKEIHELQSTIEAQEIIIKDKAQPKTCDTCAHIVTIGCYGCIWYHKDLLDKYEPKAQYE